MERHLLESFMRRCIDLARLGMGFTSPNPNVGSIVVHGQRIIGEGYHRAFGQAHAEDLAIQDALRFNAKDLPHSTIFISLEPCYHHGHTPPCVDLIIKYQIPRVVISTIDPYPKVAGRSIQKLKNHGVEVITDVLAEEGGELLIPFSTRIHEHRPYVLLKVAVDRNGNMASKGKSVWLSNYLSKVYVHRLRAMSDAILVGANTVLIDDPELNNRHYYGKSPRRYVYDRNLSLGRDYRIFSFSDQVTVFTQQSENSFEHNGDKHIQLNGEESLSTQILRTMFDQGINSLLVEGGNRTFNHFIKDSLWDELVIIHTPAEIKENPVPFLTFKGKRVDQFKLGMDIVDHWLNTNQMER